MSKIKTAFFCSNCGYESTKWTGRCPSCGEWNTFVEEVIEKSQKDNKIWKGYGAEKGDVRTIALHEVITTGEKRIAAADAELNRVLGGGIVNGSLVLVAGEPGIGKSTLFLQNGLWFKEMI